MIEPPAGSVTHHVEIHRGGRLVADGEVVDHPGTGVHALLQTASAETTADAEATLVDEIDDASEAPPGSAVVIDLPAEATVMLERVVEVYDDVESHRAGDRVIVTGTVADPATNRTTADATNHAALH